MLSTVSATSVETVFFRVRSHRRIQKPHLVRRIPPTARSLVRKLGLWPNAESATTQRTVQA